jgi:hypothetical protein
VIVAESNLLFSWDEQDETPLSCTAGRAVSPTDLFDANAELVDLLGIDTEILGDRTPAAAYGARLPVPLDSDWMMLECAHLPPYRAQAVLYRGIGSIEMTHPTEFSQPNVYRRMLRFWMDPGHANIPTPTIHPAVKAVRDIVGWLGISQTDAIAVSGISERTFYHWQSNPEVNARANQVARLSRLRALIESMVSDLGKLWVANWFQAGHPTRLDQLRQDPSALDSIEAEGLGVIRDHLRSSLDGVPVSPEMVTDRLDPIEFAHAEVARPDAPSRLILPGDER